MRNNYRSMMEKRAQFNRWELEYNTNISRPDRLKQFIHLFDLALSFPDEIIERAHQEHLKGLINCQKRLMTGKR